MRRFVSVWLPNWPLTRLARAEPGRVPEHEPFALVDFGPRGIIVTALNGAAAREGIVPGMALTDARAALPALRACPGYKSQDARVLFKLSQWAGRYGPSRAHEDHGMDGFWSDTTGVAHLYGGEEGLLDDLISRLVANRIPARAALADTYGASYALVRFGLARDRTFLRVPEGETQDALAPLPVEALRLEHNVVVLLRRLGLKRIGDLYGIPRVSLAQRFASADAAERVLFRLDQALGRAAEPLKPYFELPSVFARRSFPEPLISSPPLEAVIETLCDEVGEMLKSRDEGSRGLRLAYFRADGTFGMTGCSMRTYSNDAAHFKMLLRPRFAKIDAGFGIDLVSLEAVHTGPCASEQQGFSEDAQSYDSGPLVDALSNRLGPAAVTIAAPRESHIPERSEVFVPALDSPSSPWGGGRGGGSAEKRGMGKPGHSEALRTDLQRDALEPNQSEGNEAYMPPWPYGKGVRRPPFLLSRPEPISVIAEIPDGPPARFTWRRVERRIARAQGPERIAPEWWRFIGRAESAKRPRTRDYYEIEDEAGAAYWVFRHGLYNSGGEEDGEPPSWFLHGLFC